MILYLIPIGIARVVNALLIFINACKHKKGYACTKKRVPMTYPEFFNAVPTITLQDPLSEFLSTFEDGYIQFTYLDVVKSAGHSCPTVAGAYAMCYKALKALYPNETPQRGSISVHFKEAASEGTTGVMANVITQITGASDEKGFKGMQGQFRRHALLSFGNSALPTMIRFTRQDTNESVDLSYHPQHLPAKPEMMPLMQKLLSGSATKDERSQFGALWQERVAEILIKNFDNDTLIAVTKV